MNIYVPPASFFQRIVNIMVTETEGFLICGGDLIRLWLELDSSNRKVPDSSTLHKKVRTLFEEVGLIDI